MSIHGIFTNYHRITSSLSRQYSTWRELSSRVSNWIFASVPPHHLGNSSSEATSEQTFFPDLNLAKTFRQRYYLDPVDHGTLQSTLANPEIIASYLRVATVMHAQGLIPLVHGQSAIWMIPQRILKKLQVNHCELLRPCLESSSSFRETVVQMIDSERERRSSSWIPLYNRLSIFKTLDLQPQLRDRLLSVTIGLFHCEAKNAPLSFVLGGTVLRGPHSIPCRYPGNQSLMEAAQCKKLSNRMITIAMDAKGYSPTVSERLIASLTPLYEAAERANVGQIIVIGIPQRYIHRFAYHCETGGLPSGIPIQKVLESIAAGSIPQIGCQARLLLCKEMTDPANGLKVVNMMDETAVNSYCGSQADFMHVLESVFGDLYKNSECVEQNLQNIGRNSCPNLNQLHQIAEKIDRLMETL